MAHSLQRSQGRKELKADTGKMELMKTWRSAVCWTAPHGLLNLLSYSAQGHLPRTDTALSGPCLPTSTVNQEMPHGLLTGGDIFSTEVPLPKRLSLCQVDKILVKTGWRDGTAGIRVPVAPSLEN